MRLKTSTCVFAAVLLPCVVVVPVRGQLPPPIPTPPSPAVSAPPMQAPSGGSSPAHLSPKVEWDGGVARMSRLEDGQTTLKESFRFRNTGSVPISIDSASASCGCTVPNYTSEVVEPGAEGVVELSYGTKLAGHGKEVRAIIMFSDGGRTDLTWLIKNSPNPATNAEPSAPPSAPRSAPLEWKGGDITPREFGLEMTPGTQITGVSGCEHVKATASEDPPGSGKFVVRVERLTQSPFWGAVTVQTDPTSTPPLRINVRALR